MIRAPQSWQGGGTLQEGTIRAPRNLVEGNPAGGDNWGPPGPGGVGGTLQEGHSGYHTVHSFSTALEAVRAGLRLAHQLGAAKPCPVCLLQHCKCHPCLHGAASPLGRWQQGTNGSRNLGPTSPSTTRGLWGRPVVVALPGTSGRGASGRDRNVAARNKCLDGYSEARSPLLSQRKIRDT